MMEIKRRVQIDLEAPAVFALLADLHRRPDWVTTTVRTYGVPRGPLRGGQRFMQTMRVAGREMESEWRVVQVEPQRSLVYEVVCPGGGHLSMAQTIISSGESSRVEIAVRYELPPNLLGGPLREEYIGRRIEREVAVSLHNLRDLLEGQVGQEASEVVKTAG